MNLRPFKASLCLVLTVLNALLACGGTARASVLCVGPDGHVAIEFSGTPSACPVSPDGDSCADGDLTLDGRSCVDVPITAGATLSNGRTAPGFRPLPHDLPAPVAFAPSLALPAVRLASTFAPAHANHGDTALGALRTVILVI